MNSIWNKNISLFTQRFPQLAQQFSLNGTQDIPQELLAPVEIIEARNGQKTARENSRYFHSAYNPEREAEQTVKNAREIKKDIFTAVFYSMGLGYAADKWAELYPNDSIIIVESDPRYFFTALAYNDLSHLLRQPNLIFALQADQSQVINIIERCGGIAHASIVAVNAQADHAHDYYIALTSLLERNRTKAEINTSTLEKFSHLWLRNSCRNLDLTAGLDGVARYKDKCPHGLPALVLAAGPTLDEVLPYLKELKKKCLIIAVDTALRACLRAGTEPDFIVLVDPQYYASRHIEGLKSPSSVLVTESAAYPSVFHFDCREIILCSALFPLGQYFEKRLGAKGELGAGGSVSTTAWDFARMCGADEIYFAGLDLGYPGLQTHIRGSTFEEKIHSISDRKSTAEKAGIASLFAAGVKKDRDYSGNEILTDEKMKMFAWWFESKCVEYSSIKTFTLSPRSLKIPGFETALINTLLERPDAEEKRSQFFACEKDSQFRNNPAEFAAVKESLREGLEDLYKTARNGVHSAEKGLVSTGSQTGRYLNELDETDRKILASELKDAASLVFPTERRLNEIFDQTVFPEDKAKAVFLREKIIYTQLMQAIKSYLQLL
ncbi:MAG: motility associated factor glycosyltransferase family protein [Treponema sp.]|nr:motility associated factor glycosyltransferase family protein [Treponema sp.]